MSDISILELNNRFYNQGFSDGLITGLLFYLVLFFFGCVVVFFIKYRK